MSTAEALLENERSALNHNQVISHVLGKNNITKKKGGISVILALAVTLVIFMVFFMSSNMLPAAISERLIEETDIQYADAVESKMVAFKQALLSGDVPDDTVEKLSKNGVQVGHLEDDEFIEENKSGKSLFLKFLNKIIAAKDFVTEANQNSQLYEAFNNATYSRAAYYYDQSAKRVFRQLGITSRDNYNSNTSFEETTSRILGEGSNIRMNNVVMVEKTKEENGETITYYEYETLGDSASSSSDSFIESVTLKSRGVDTNDATINAANSLNIADTISKEQRSGLLYVAFMENFSKMKAGDGNEAKVNEIMNKLYEQSESQVVDINTGEVITVSGSMVESPSLYAILTNTKVDTNAVRNYSSDRILKLTESTLGINSVGNDTLKKTITSTKTKITGSIGRFINNGSSVASYNTLSNASPIIKESLINNSYNTINGVSGGELLVEGAVNVGRALAKASGATAGSEEAVKSYARLTTSILAMDAEVDRRNRSPFDITSKNTFLGSILYSMATTIKPGSFLTQVASFGRSALNSFASIFPTTYADDSTERYLANFGDCETLNSIGATGSATCSEIATFDSSTLDGIFEDEGFIKFVEENTFLDDSGTRVIKSDSSLATFINYNNNRLTPLGVVDGGILHSLEGGNSSISFQSNILSMIEESINATDDKKRIASGESFINSSSNPEWETTYKYAQRYVSLARAIDSLRQFSDGTAYTSLEFFEGTENPVIAFINSQNNIASK